MCLKVASYTDPDLFSLILSPVADCNLSDFYDTATDSEDHKAILRTFFGCLAGALSYLHRTKIRHRDIKPSNILVQWVKDPAVKAKVYLADFGISLDWAELSGSTTTDNTAKTKIYCAPEVANWEPRNSSSDIWSLGCVFLEMYSVLKGKTLAQLRGYLKLRSDELHFRNSDAVQTWTKTLITDPATPDDEIVLWVSLMLQTKGADRISASSLHELIMQYSVQKELSEIQFSCKWCMFLPETSPVPMSDSEFSGVELSKISTIPTSPSTWEERSPSPEALHDDPFSPSMLSIQALSMSDSERSNSVLVQEARQATDLISEVTPRLEVPSTQTQHQIGATLFTPEILSQAKALKGHLPKLSASSWRDPGQFLTSIDGDINFMKYLRVKHSAMFQAFRQARVEDVTTIMGIFLEAGLNPNDPEYIDNLPGEKGSCPHMWVLHNDWRSVVPPIKSFSILLRHGANVVGYEMNNGCTALTRASAQGMMDIVQMLIDLGADVNGKAERGRPLDWAIESRQLEVVELLIKSGADVKLASYTDLQPIIAAAKAGSLSVFKYLLQQGAELDCKTPRRFFVKLEGFDYLPSGYATLMAAAYSGNYDIVEYIVKVSK